MTRPPARSAEQRDRRQKERAIEGARATAEYNAKKDRELATMAALRAARLNREKNEDTAGNE
jgi:hypothetical protein